MSASLAPGRAPAGGGSPPGRGAPRLGFVGAGWIGRHRIAALAAAGCEIAAVADPDADAVAAVRAGHPDVLAPPSYEALLEADAGLDGIVIATPSALHAHQAIAALQRGIAVFCQKPLARTAEETARVVAAASAADRLLGVDLSYRHLAAVERVRALLDAGELGDVFAAELVFHNAYGPDKPWFYDPALAGGGCVIDLGVHLVDLALWCLPDARVTGAAARLYAAGRPLEFGVAAVEDYAEARLDLSTGATVRLACSWRLHAGRDAVISATFFGTRGGATVRNVGGSFFDFTAERFDGTRTETLAEPPDAWGGRAAVAWAERLAADAGYDPAVERLVDVAHALDRIYGR